MRSLQDTLQGQVGNNEKMLTSFKIEYMNVFTAGLEPSIAFLFHISKTNDKANFLYCFFKKDVSLLYFKRRQKKYKYSISLQYFDLSRQIIFVSQFF